VRFRGVALAFLSLAAFAATPTFAALEEPSERLSITAAAAATWDRDGESVVALEGPVTIELDEATLSAGRAVIWLRAEPGEGAGRRQRAEVALLGDAKVVQQDATRSGERLFVTALVTGRIRFTAETRVQDDRSDTELYEAAAAMRRANAGAAADGEPAPAPAPAPRQAEPIAPGVEPRPAPAPRPQPPAPRRGNDTTPRAPQAPPAAVDRDIDDGDAPATTAPAADVPPGAPVIFRGQFETQEMDDGTLALVFSDNVTLVQRSPSKSNPAVDEMIELQAERAVVFTRLTARDPLKDVQAMRGGQEISESITAAYLEGDVRIVLTSAEPTIGEQRLQAKRVYFEFGTDRAVMTDVVLHTVQPQLNVPVVMRARLARMLSRGEFNAQNVRLSTSRFATPSYSINAQKIYVRQEDTGDPRLGSRTAFRAINPTFRFFDVPVFYLPYASGSMTDRGSVLRGIGFENSTQFGTGVETKWGLFETLGLPRPNELDATYELDYYSDRGPAGGLDFEYGGGGLVSEALREPFNFDGDFTAYGVHDSGFDDFGRGRVGEDGTALTGETRGRGRVLWEHQHFFPDDYQLQFRGGYVSDATFLEQWFERDFNEGPPHDVSLYVKRQRDTEAYTFLANVQPSNVVTTSDLLQEQFEVERLPEVGYRRIGDSFADDRLTFYSRNTVGAYSFNTTRATLAEQGFGPGRMPGIPSIGFTGVEQDPNFRGDFRQEVAAPVNAGPFKLVPYAVGRLTSYSDSPTGGGVNRLFGAVGARASTALWRTYDGVESRLFDVHRLRHVIEPEVNVFAAAQTDDRNDVFVYEEDVDATHDLAATQLALRQRWQTKRGGPGRWRSVDFFTLNLEANLFNNQPDEDEREPRGFRGLYFASLPETSVPRNGVNVDATWRISDNTVVLADLNQNIDEGKLATAGIGLLARRDERMTYFLGNRYIDELNSNISTVALSYELSSKYTLLAAQSFDFGISENVNSSFGVLRQFDAFFVAVNASHDSINDQSAFNFNIYPKGLGFGLNAQQLGGVFRNNERQ
jgi:lipopolysaccharide export system protein LptA